MTDATLHSILDIALRVIADIGIEVPDDAFRARIVASRGNEAGRRVCFTRAETEGYLESWRQRNGIGEPGFRDEPAPAGPGPIGLSVMPYSHTYLDPRTNAHVPMTAERLTEATRFLGSFHGDGLDASVAGHPVDLPPNLQPLFEYKVSAQLNPAGGGYGWMGDPRTAGYLLRMAEVMGRPITATVVYIASPLRLGGQELETALAHRDRFAHIHVGNMGSCGATLPLMPQAALGMSWAETIAGAMCVEALTGLPANWGGGIEPFDMRAQTIPFGAPEQALYYRLARDASAWLHGRKPGGGHMPLLTMAKRPGAQSMLEKSLMASSLVWPGTPDTPFGQDRGVGRTDISLGAAGSLSADEVFSPVQVILDRELRDWLSHAMQGAEWESDGPGDVLEMIREGVELGSFVGAETTVSHYRELSWFPRHLRREMLGTWQASGSPEALATAQEEALARIESATWTLPEPQFSELEAIWEEARVGPAR